MLTLARRPECGQRPTLVADNVVLCDRSRTDPQCFGYAGLLNVGEHVLGITALWDGVLWCSTASGLVGASALTVHSPISIGAKGTFRSLWPPVSKLTRMGEAMGPGHATSNGGRNWRRTKGEEMHLQ